MKILASGHPGMEAFVEGHWPSDQVVVCSSWTAVCARLAPGDDLFLGSRLPGLPTPQALASALERALGTGSLVLWVGEDEETLWRSAFAGLGQACQLWVGQIGAERLRGWVDGAFPGRSGSPAPIPPLPRRWAVYTEPRGICRVAFWRQVVAAASAQLGRGVLVDAAWADPRLSASELAGREGFASAPTHHLWLRRTPYGFFVPAPPPWLLGATLPDPGAFRRLASRGEWIAFDLGADLRTPLWQAVLPWVEEFWLVAEEASRWQEWEEVWRVVRGIRPQVAAVVWTHQSPAERARQAMALLGCEVRTWPGGNPESSGKEPLGDSAGEGGQGAKAPLARLSWGGRLWSRFGRRGWR
ncbi:MAG: hypothetical protein K6U87_00830 [Firmicutes bacterium]|nr:hypothetical protein [Bacillota bacterium]